MRSEAIPAGAGAGRGRACAWTPRDRRPQPQPLASARRLTGAQPTVKNAPAPFSVTASLNGAARNQIQQGRSAGQLPRPYARGRLPHGDVCHGCSHGRRPPTRRPGSCLAPAALPQGPPAPPVVTARAAVGTRKGPSSNAPVGVAPERPPVPPGGARIAEPLPGDAGRQHVAAVLPGKLQTRSGNPRHLPSGSTARARARMRGRVSRAR